MPTAKPTVVLVDNSVAFTGAFKAALQQALLLREHYRFVFVLPQQTTLVPQVKDAGIAVYCLPMREIKKSAKALLLYLPTLLANGRLLRRIAEKENARLIVMNDFYNLLGVVVKRRKPQVGLVTYVRFLPFALPGPLRKVWTALGRKYADGLIAVSDAVRQQLPPGLNTVRLYDAVLVADDLSFQPPSPSGVTRFLYVGNYIPGKGQDHALAAFGLACKQQENIRLTFVGGDMGLKKNKAFKQSLQTKAAADGLGDRITFAPFATDVGTALREADVVLNFSEAESFSMTVAEACAYGRPVIATRCGGPEEIIADGETGLLVANKNVEEMCSAMLRLAGDRALQIRFGREARAYVQRKFGVDAFVTECTGIYNGVITATAT